MEKRRDARPPDGNPQTRDFGQTTREQASGGRGGSPVERTTPGCAGRRDGGVGPAKATTIVGPRTHARGDASAEVWRRRGRAASSTHEIRRQALIAATSQTDSAPATGIARQL